MKKTFKFASLCTWEQIEGLKITPKKVEIWISRLFNSIVLMSRNCTPKKVEIWISRLFNSIVLMRRNCTPKKVQIWNSRLFSSILALEHIHFVTQIREVWSAISPSWNIAGILRVPIRYFGTQITKIYELLRKYNFGPKIVKSVFSLGRRSNKFFFTSIKTMYP